MRINAISALGFAVLLAGCASQPPQSLNVRLAGATPEERHEIIRLACLNEADWDLDRLAERQPLSRQHNFAHSNSTPETSHLRRLCRTMSDLSPSSDAREKDAVADQCRKELNEHAGQASPKRAAHLERLRMICEAAVAEDVGGR